jgi:hypothetical protein
MICDDRGGGGAVQSMVLFQWFPIWNFLKPDRFHNIEILKLFRFTIFEMISVLQFYWNWNGLFWLFINLLNNKMGKQNSTTKATTSNSSNVSQGSQGSQGSPMKRSQGSPMKSPAKVYFVFVCQFYWLLLLW